MLQYYFCFTFCFFGHKACGILDPDQGSNLRPPLSLEGEVLTTGPKGKSLLSFVYSGFITLECPSFAPSLLFSKSRFEASSISDVCSSRSIYSSVISQDVLISVPIYIVSFLGRDTVTYSFLYFLNYHPLQDDMYILPTCRKGSVKVDNSHISRSSFQFCDSKIIIHYLLL